MTEPSLPWGDEPSAHKILLTLVEQVRTLTSALAAQDSKLDKLSFQLSNSLGPSFQFANPSKSSQEINPGTLNQLHRLPSDSISISSAPSNLINPSQLASHSPSGNDTSNGLEKAKFVDWMRKEDALISSLNSNPLPLTSPKQTTIYPQRVILTTYPGQTGIHPIPLEWGASDPQKRGPVVASRHPQSLKIRNAIGAYSGSYCIYKALATAIGAINPNHRPDFTNTQPPFNISPNPAWFDPTKIVSMDPWGHLTPQIFKSYFKDGVDIRPTIACTKAHLKLAELDDAAAEGRLLIDGKIVVKSPGAWVAPLAAEAAFNATGGDWKALPENESQLQASKKAGVEVRVTKAAVEPVWDLPGVSARFGIPEGILRRALFEDTGGMYPELLTRNDLKTYLPPIGGLTVYIFGDPTFVSDPSKELTLRVHDECNGSDVFGSSICTCRPYLLYGIEEAIKCAQRGGSGVVIYFRKEGRALGEVTKYLVYNARKRGGDSAALYFQRTESIAGVKDMRFQALMPDVLHWLGIKKIDVMCSMSDMKHDAIVQSGIPILVRKDIPDHLIPSDSRVEIDAKIAAGYYSASKVVTEEDLKNTVGQSWEDVDH
ncbi:hypothetical protein O181_065660 [Austropuccinia psidii MF-1]|uniref:GTP cyclohydrolase II n=1 Tax=Austropuccinia psidii MF-1 TaxID=1389203 RepID=A0A9Q3EML8_9BASI|nr:hypothetical protein [Austropuccinia psidii MF-1]